jgi:hemolysin III
MMFAAGFLGKLVKDRSWVSSGECRKMSLPKNLPRHLKRPYSRGELIADGLVHGVAILAGIVGFAVLLALVFMRGSILEGFAVAVYAAGFFAMFGFSLAYNMTSPSPLKWLLRRFDHSSIYLMIAGTYTPLLAQLHDWFWAWTLALVVWIGAIAGIVLKVALPGRFDRLSIVAYLLLGWVAVIAAKPLIVSLPGSTLVLIAVGGLLYSTGIVFYLWHNLRFQNAIWHLFVAVAASCHYAGIFVAVARASP